MATILSRYIFKELLLPFGVCLIFLTLIFLMSRIPEITNMVVNYNTGISSIFMLLLYTVPRFMEFTIPMSVMISVLLTVMRMSNDNEIIALKGGGISIYKIVPPIIFFCVIGTIISLWITIWAMPCGRLAFRVKGAELAKTTINLSLKERQFNNTFDNFTIYISSIDINTGEFSDIFIEESKDPDSINITIASKGALLSSQSESGEDDDGTHTLRLYKGVINQVNMQNRSVNSMNFDTYDINFDTKLSSQDILNQSKDFDEMTLNELLQFIKNGKSKLNGELNKMTITSKMLNSAKMELHEKFAIPFACISLGLLAVPVGVRSSSSRRSSGFGLALTLFLLYYLLLAAAWSAGKTGNYPPAIGMWLPNVVMGGAAIYMLLKVAQEKPLLNLLKR
ncbi:MAG: LPS export ABC transporter permease LptF [Desulfamplus sp.]|nr:LPS export ABC transporter permease LptF [Desulfamplus sp.]